MLAITASDVPFKFGNQTLMFWKKRSSAARMRMLAFRALFAAGCFSAFAIFGWGIETGTVLELLVFLILVVVAMIVPAALFVALLKLISYGLKRMRSESSEDA